MSYYENYAFRGFSPCPGPFLEWQRFVNLASPFHQGEEQLDTKLFLRAVSFILRCLCSDGGGGGEGRKELWRGKGGKFAGLQKPGEWSSIFYLYCCSHYRYLGCFCISMTFLYFLGKYDVMLAIVVASSNSIWCPISMSCSDNADCVTCFSLTSRWCSFIRRLTILPVSPMYTYPQEQDILYAPAELSEGLWSLGCLKICSIF